MSNYTNANTTEKIDIATNSNWEYWCEGLPIESLKLAEFWQEVKKACPNLIIKDGGRAVTKLHDKAPDQRLKVFYHLQIATADTPDTTIGGLEYDKHGDEYTISSRLIENAKYGRWNSQHHSRTSKHMKKLIKVAKENLLPLQFKEVVEDSFATFQNKLAEIRSRASSQLRDALFTISGEDWRAELLNMHSIGYTPKSQKIRSAIERLVTGAEEFDKCKSYMPEYSMVWIKPTQVEYADSTPNSMSFPTKANVTSNVETLPIELRSKVMVLMMCDNKSFVEEVGMKVNDSQYWIIK